MLRIGVAGLGGMGFLHARNALGIAGAQLTAVASTRPERAAEVAAHTESLAEVAGQRPEVGPAATDDLDLGGRMGAGVE